MELLDFKKVCEQSEIKKNCFFDGFGLMGKNVDSKGRLFFLGDKSYIKDFIQIDSAGVICTEEIYNEIRNIYNGGIAICENPRGAFFHYYEEVSKYTKNTYETVIPEDSYVHETAIISKSNVKIGHDVHIGSNAVVHSGVVIEDGVTIEENCVIGCIPLYVYEYKDNIKTLSTRGLTIISKGAHIHIGSMIDSGIFDYPTIVGKSTTIGGMSLIGHNSIIGDNCMLGGRNITGGWVNISNEVYSGISATYAPNVEIGENAYICAGSVVLKNVKDGDKVMGNPARKV